MSGHLIRHFLFFTILFIFTFSQATFAENTIEEKGWCSWRGPFQNGRAYEIGLTDVLSLEKPVLQWTKGLKMRGTPVTYGDLVYVIAYEGEQDSLCEGLYCFVGKTGELKWKKEFRDFLSDVIYDRYSIGAPTIDGATGNVYVMSTAGVFFCFSSDGKLIWEKSMLEQYGRNTYPNGRTGSPVIYEDTVLIRGVTNNWGVQGPPKDRFYCFDKRSGELIWWCEPGLPPPALKDSCFSTPVLGLFHEQEVFYVGTGCGNIVCINAHTGKLIWRYRLCFGGVNSSVVLYQNKYLIAVHGRENFDSTTPGRMVCIDLKTIEKDQVELSQKNELWRIDEIAAFSSSPILVDDLVYQVGATGELYCVDIKTGKMHWVEKLSSIQIHASPAASDGKLFVPMNNGEFYLIKPTREKCEILSKIQLEGNCLGAPCIWDGVIYVGTTAKLYAFGKHDTNKYNLTKKYEFEVFVGGMEIVDLQVVPNEFILKAGESVQLSVFGLNNRGHRVKEFKSDEVSIEKVVPEKGKPFQVSLKGNVIKATSNEYTSGDILIKSNDLKVTCRGRVLPKGNFAIDFEKTPLVIDKPNGSKVGFPPKEWIGGIKKWEVVDLEGNKVLSKTLDALILQRALTFFADESYANYTMQADVMSDGNRRVMSDVGFLHQRYQIVLRGNAKEIEISSNLERFLVKERLQWKPNVWYTLKSNVVIENENDARIQVKVWEKGQAEPEAWTFETLHKNGHLKGSPGLYGFAVNNAKAVYVDNIKITMNP